jgi:ketopantoate reductase
MKIAIVGSGNVGGALGARLLEAGHDVRFAVRAVDPPRDDRRVGRSR